MNRLASYLEEPQEPELDESFFIVETTSYWFPVTADTARRIERQLDRWWGPRWITFTDLYGGRRRVLRSTVDLVYESTPALRAAARAFRRARKHESETERNPWEDR